MLIAVAHTKKLLDPVGLYALLKFKEPSAALVVKDGITEHPSAGVTQ